MKKYLALALLTIIPLINAGASKAEKNEIFDIISMVGQKIGSVHFLTEVDPNKKSVKISTELKSTPLGIFNGVSTNIAVQDIYDNVSHVKYISKYESRLKSRIIKYETKQNKLINLSIQPDSENTSLSSKRKLKTKFINPAYAFLKVSSFPCQDNFFVYDGRRLAEVTLVAQILNNTCKYQYSIKEGPGHFAPF